MKKIANLKKFRQEFDLTQEQVGEIVGITKQSIWSHEQNNTLPLKYWRKLEAKYGFKYVEHDSDTDDSMPENDIIELARIYIKPECGAGTELMAEPYIEPFRISRQSISTYLRCSSPENLKLFQATGDSMESKISDGDWLLVDVGRRDVNISGIYIFTANGLYRCKRLNMTLDGRLEVKSDNKKYDSEVLGPDSGVEINIIGRVLNNLSRGI